MASSEQNHSGYGIDGYVSKDEMMGRADVALERAFKEAGSEKYKGKTHKLFGFFEVPAAAAVVLKGFTNEVLGVVQGVATPWTFDKLEKLSLDKLQYSHTTAGNVAAVGAFATSAAIRSSVYLSGIWQAKSEQFAESKKMAHQVASALDDVKGNHSLLAYMSVKKDDNAMIYAHRKRMSIVAGVKTNNQIIDWVSNAGINMLPQFGILHGMWKKETPDLLRDRVKLAAETQFGDMHHGHTDGAKHNNAQAMLFTRFRTMGAPLVAEGLIASNNKKLDELSEFSALQMVTHLEDQVTNNPQDKTFKLPGNKGREVPLEQYILAVMKQYQQDLSAIDPEQSQLRESLLEDLALVAKPMAEAIRKGNMSALGLVTLIGGGHVIKSHGRVIASADEVAAEIERMGGKEHKVHRSAKDYYANHGYDAKQLKTTLMELKKDPSTHEEYVLLASWHSDEVLADAGISASEIKKIREEIGDHYLDHTLDVFRGVVSMDVEELHTLGLPTVEAKKLIEYAHYLEKHGEKSFAELLESPTNAHGVEGLMADLVVPNNKISLQDLVLKGRASNDNARNTEEERSASHAERTRGTQPSSHAERERMRAADDHKTERHKA